MENKIFYIQSGSNFIDALASGIQDRFQDIVELSKIKIFLPTKKSVVSFEKAIIKKVKIDRKNKPEVISLGDLSYLSNDNFLFKNDFHEKFEEKEINKLSILISEVSRSVLLSKLINQWKKHQGRPNEDIKNLLDLSEELGKLLDETDINQFNENTLAKIIPSDIAFHWRDVGSFLNIIMQSWPKIAKENYISSKADNYYHAINNLIKTWKEKPPSSHVIIAGSTGSVPVTRKLIQLISTLPKGIIIIPGVDINLDSDSWKYVDEKHPQFNIKTLLSSLSVNRGNLSKWNEDKNLRNVDRDFFVSQIMTPLEKIDNWSKKSKSKYNLDRFYRIYCNSENEESRVICAIINETFKKTNKSISLVTLNRSLVRRVLTELERRKIKEINFSNNNLSNTLEGNFILNGAKFLSEDFTLVNLLSLFKHELSFAQNQSNHISGIEYFEKKYLRKPFPINSIEQIINLVNRSECLEDKTEYLQNNIEFNLWIIDILNTVLEYRRKFDKAENNIKKLFQYNIELVLWCNSRRDFFCKNDSITKNQKLIENINKINIIFSNITDIELIDRKNYTNFLFKIFNTILEERNFKNEFRVNIWTPFESRLHKSDVVILSDLNEDSWSSIKETSPWLSLSIKKKLGINIEQRRISLLAHDFVQNICSSEVYLTRSIIKNRKQTSPSRWLVRINNLIGPQSKIEINKETDIKIIANAFYEPDLFIESDAPIVRPPLKYRPRTLSITDVDLLINNPYALYVKKILGIKPLNPISFEPDLSKQGQFIHKALEIFSKEVSFNGIKPSIENLLNVGKTLLSSRMNNPIINSFWWPRFEEIASWCINNQRNLFEDKLITEERGSYIFKTKFGKFELKGKADRIEILDDGCCGIIDYKTASIPNKSEIEKGIKPQLQLLGLIAELGKFEKVDFKKVSYLKYLKLASSNDRGFKNLKNINNLINDAENGLKKLIYEFDNPKTPYLFNPWHDNKIYDEYRQLSRYDIWMDKK